MADLDGKPFVDYYCKECAADEIDEVVALLREASDSLEKIQEQFEKVKEQLEKLLKEE